MLQIKRVYEKPAQADGYRVLVDRVWPRGLTQERAAVKEWVKEIAPSTELRQYFGHDPKRWTVFQTRYQRELNANPQAQKTLATLRRLSRKQTVTLVYGAHDEKYNQAVVLQKLLQRNPASTRS